MKMIEKALAIDGPSGSGKSTVAQMVAAKLNFIYLNTGALYRSIAFYLLKNSSKKDASSEKEVKEQLKNIKLDYFFENNQMKVMLNGEDVTSKITRHDVSDLSSQISKYQVVRDFLLEFQRNFARENFCVAEGRDVGTVVFPHAFCKIFMTATAEERAQRRFKELSTREENKKLTYEQILQDIQERDRRDEQRILAPLKQAEDAFFLDTTGKTIDEIVSEIVSLAQKKQLEKNLEKKKDS